MVTLRGHTVLQCAGWGDCVCFPDELTKDIPQLQTLALKSAIESGRVHNQATSQISVREASEMRSFYTHTYTHTHARTHARTNECTPIHSSYVFKQDYTLNTDLWLLMSPTLRTLWPPVHLRWSSVHSTLGLPGKICIHCSAVN